MGDKEWQGGNGYYSELWDPYLHLSDISAFRNVEYESGMEHGQSLGSPNSPGTMLTGLTGLSSVALGKATVDGKKKKCLCEYKL